MWTPVVQCYQIWLLHLMLKCFILAKWHCYFLATVSCRRELYRQKVTKLWVSFPSKPYTTLYLEWRHLINRFSCSNECWPVADQYCCSQLIASELNAARALSQDEVRRESLVRDSGPSVERFQICLNQECRTLLLSKKASPPTHSRWIFWFGSKEKLMLISIQMPPSLQRKPPPEPPP